MTTTFDSLSAGDLIDGPKFAVTRESIRLFCDASLDYNPLHLDDDYMQGSFGKTSFGGVIMHGMNNFGLISRMITDWAYPAGAIHRRLETRWVKPVRPGDTIQPSGIIFRPDLAHDHRLGLSARRDPSSAGDPLGQAGTARRHHSTDRHHQVPAGDRQIALGTDRCNGTQPGRREGRHGRSHGGVSGKDASLRQCRASAARFGDKAR